VRAIIPEIFNCLSHFEPGKTSNLSEYAGLNTSKRRWARTQSGLPKYL
jgi:hypothetical protein